MRLRASKPFDSALLGYVERNVEFDCDDNLGTQLVAMRICEVVSGGPSEPIAKIVTGKPLLLSPAPPSPAFVAEAVAKATEGPCEPVASAEVEEPGAEPEAAASRSGRRKR